MRRRAARVLSGIFAFGWIVVPGFGAIDLTVTWDPDWPQVLEAGWGLYFTVVVGVPFVVAAARPRAAAPASRNWRSQRSRSRSRVSSHGSAACSCSLWQSCSERRSSET